MVVEVKEKEAGKEVEVGVKVGVEKEVVDLEVVDLEV